MNNFDEFQLPLTDRLFDEEKMYTYIKTYAMVKELNQTIKVLPFARELHKDQYRKGRDHIPYIYHPLLICCHALALGMDEDDILSTALLHDVCEDCNISSEMLPVNEKTREAVVLLTKTFSSNNKTEQEEEQYFKDISENQIAIMVKLLDRCSNISEMSTGFSQEKIYEYINDTEKWVYPLFKTAQTNYPMYSNQVFCIKYHMTSVIDTLKHQLRLYGQS